MPIIDGLFAEEHLKAEFAARVTGGDSAGCPVHGSDFISFHVPSEANPDGRASGSV
jgi:hypothetical protein